MIAMLFTPVRAADDQSSKQEVDKIAATYAENYNKQNSAGIAALFTKDGVLVNPTGRILIFLSSSTEASRLD